MYEELILKRKLYITYRPVCEILEMLSPYFEVDHLLPRTVTASMNLQILHGITTANIIPVDVVLASTYFNCSTLKKCKELVSF